MQQRANVVANVATVENLVPPQGNLPVQIHVMTPGDVPPPVINPPFIEKDDQHNAFFIPRASSIYDVFVPLIVEVEKKVRAIEEKLKVVEGSNYIGVYASEMCLVSGVRILVNFKVSDFEKYKGSSHPRMHIRSYCRKMASYSYVEGLLMHFFQDSSNGALLD